YCPVDGEVFWGDDRLNDALGWFKHGRSRWPDVGKMLNLHVAATEACPSKPSRLLGRKFIQRTNRGEAMKAITTTRYATMVSTMALAWPTACSLPSIASAAPEDEAAIRALEDRFAAAFNAGD